MWKLKLSTNLREKSKTKAYIHKNEKQMILKHVKIANFIHIMENYSI